VADTRETTREMKIKMYFVDGDDRTLTLKNPRSDVTSADIESLQSFMQTEQPLIGDKLGAAFGKITSAKTIQTEDISLDIDN
jgi:hypothetical protein